ncbi:ABC transporter ATP-binding protein [Agromyces sp. LHK192]|uniref:ABC transporter ATP-binding protein n=1 Tax=Agromyces sp. LHK192 TaxID=2498704 RepID=UPI000FD7B28D|nr:ABC transporter ATP-binding protein [Agromyces sp. LHK192]
MSLEILPVATPKQIRREVGQLFSSRRLALTGAVVVLLASAIAGLAMPALLGRIVDAAIDGDATALPALVAAIAGFGVAYGALTGSGRMLVARLGERVLADLRGRVVTRILRLPLPVVERAGRGDLVARAAGDTRIVGEVVSGVLPVFASAGFSIVVTIVGLGVIDWRFSLAALAAVPVQAFALRGYLRRSRPVYRDARAADGDRSQRILESIDAVDTVRAMGASAPREADIEQAAIRSAELEFRSSRIAVDFWNRLNAAEFVGLAAVLAVGFWLVGADLATVGQATAAALYFHALFGPVGSVLSGVDDLQRAGAGLARLVGVLELPEQAPRRAASAGSAAPVRFDGVRFGYDAQPAVDDLTFRVEAGETVALVGASGAGKSTVAALVLGTLLPDDGRIRLGADGAPPRVGVAGQEPHVFAGTLADDLRMAAPDASDDALHDALTRVGAAEWAARLPDGLDTVVGSGGHALTPTQSQQLMLARLVLHDPGVLVLDEATAADGGASEPVLERAARDLAAGRTTITIAHRLDQAAQADRVIVLDRGRLVESGTHADLVAADGVYAELWTAWSRAHDSRRPPTSIVADGLTVGAAVAAGQPPAGR